jgi:hypothetical protein
MTLALFKFVCANGHEFEAPDASGEYGEFVVRGEVSPEPGMLQALDDPIYSEVDDLLRELGAFDGKTENEQPDLLQSVFGVACDHAPDGTSVQIGRKAPCPVCGTRKMASWEPIGAYMGSVFNVTHVHWQTLGRAQKKALIATA